MAHTKLFYRESYRSDYRKVEIATLTLAPMVIPEIEPAEVPTDIPSVEIPLKLTLTPELTLTPIPTDIPTPIPSVEIIVTEDAVDTSDQITTPSDVGDQVYPTITPPEVL